MMRIVKTWSSLDASQKGASIAIGNFDGVHRGHQAVIDIAREKAGPESALGILTFEPHPREYFAPEAPPFRLMNAASRAHRLEKLGVDLLYELHFDEKIASLSPREFATDVLANGLGVKHVIIGADFYFGKGRSGTAEDLRDMGKSLGFETTIAPLLMDGTVDVSSTAIRKALSEGRPRDAAAMLGHWHRIDGEVISGDSRGHGLGYPTANMSIRGLHAPKFGIYAVLADVLTGPNAGSYRGAASLGVRPTFGENLPALETFLFDFEGSLYGEQLSIAFVEYLRPEEAYDDLDALITQIGKDCDQAREILNDLQE